MQIKRSHAHTHTRNRNLQQIAYNGDASSEILKRYILLRVMNNCKLDEYRHVNYAVWQSILPTEKTALQPHALVTALFAMSPLILNLAARSAARFGAIRLSRHASSKSPLTLTFKKFHFAGAGDRKNVGCHRIQTTTKRRLWKRVCDRGHC